MPVAAPCVAQLLSTAPPLLDTPPLSPEGVTDELLKKPAPDGKKLEAIELIPFVQTYDDGAPVFPKEFGNPPGGVIPPRPEKYGTSEWR
jgi:hypothetical protein